jgi:hypothetical protein
MFDKKKNQKFPAISQRKEKKSFKNTVHDLPQERKIRALQKSTTL